MQCLTWNVPFINILEPIISLCSFPEVMSMKYSLQNSYSQQYIIILHAPHFRRIVNFEYNYFTMFQID